jgi:hypothetical protein
VLLDLPGGRDSFLLPPAAALSGSGTLQVSTLTAFLDLVGRDPGVLQVPDDGGGSGYHVHQFGDTDNAARLVRLVRENDVSMPAMSA